jgi:hypothetical protein
MKKLRRYKLTALVALLAFLPVVYKLLPPQFPIWALVGVGLLIAGVAAYIEHYRNVQPQLKLEDKKTYLFRQTCDKAFDELRQYDNTARLNIMEIDRGPWGLWGKFDIVFSRGMERELDKDLKLKLSQGVCGQAVQQKELVVANVETKQGGPAFGLDSEQLRKTQHLTLIFSMPIRRAKMSPDGTLTLTDDIIGVVNLDSKMPGAEAYYNTTETVTDAVVKSLRVRQEEVLGEISEVCSIIVS